MKRTKKRVLVSAACLLGVSLLTGCVQKFDAEGYVKACLDALYMRDYEEYAQQVGISVEEAQSDMEGQVDESLESAFAGDTLTSEEDRQAYRDTMIEIYSLAKYEVTGSEENDGYLHWLYIFKHFVAVCTWKHNVQ